VSKGGQLGRKLKRAITSRELDLYVLAAAAFVFTLLGTIGLANAAALSSAILALLAFLAVAQIKSRRQVEQITAAQKASAADILRNDFPEVLIERRAGAQTLMLIGISLGRTIETAEIGLRKALSSGTTIRALLVDPSDDAAVRSAASRIGELDSVEHLRASILHSLTRLERWRRDNGGTVEIRVTGVVPHIGVNAIDVDRRDGLLVVQMYEYLPAREASPIFSLEPKDGLWFDHFAQEAARMWDDARPWPPTPEEAVRQAARPVFTDHFSEDLFRLAENAAEVFVTGVTRNTFLNSEFSRWERLIGNGCRMRFLLVDPDSDAIAIAAERYYVYRSPEAARERGRFVLNLLRELKAATGGNLEVRLTHYPLSLGIVAVDPVVPGTSRSAIFAEYYQYQAGAEPKFVINGRDRPWYKHFIDEAETLWNAATPFPLDSDPT
jgi:hypothetical protein